MVARAQRIANDKTELALSDEMIEFIDHLAELLAEEFANAMKESEASDNASGDLR